MQRPFEMKNTRERISVAAAIASALQLLHIHRLLLCIVTASVGGEGSCYAHGQLCDGPQSKRRRCSFPRPVYKDSAWWRMLQHPHLLEGMQSREAKAFRQRFRVPYVFFRELVEVVKRANLKEFILIPFRK